MKNVDSIMQKYRDDIYAAQLWLSTNLHEELLPRNFDKFPEHYFKELSWPWDQGRDRIGIMRTASISDKNRIGDVKCNGLVSTSNISVAKIATQVSFMGEYAFFSGVRIWIRKEKVELFWQERSETFQQFKGRVRRAMQDMLSHHYRKRK